MDLGEDTTDILLETSCCIHLISNRLEAARYVILCKEALSGLDIYVTYYVLECNLIPHVLCSFLHVFFHFSSLAFGECMTINYLLNTILFFLLSFSIILLSFV